METFNIIIGYRRPKLTDETKKCLIDNDVKESGTEKVELWAFNSVIKDGKTFTLSYFTHKDISKSNLIFEEIIKHIQNNSLNNKNTLVILHDGEKLKFSEVNFRVLKKDFKHLYVESFSGGALVNEYIIDKSNKILFEGKTENETHNALDKIWEFYAFDHETFSNDFLDKLK